MADIQSDAMIARLEGELEERNAFIQGTIANVQDAGRDLSDNETELIKNAQDRILSIRSQLDTLYSSRQTTIEARQRAHDVNAELARMRHTVDAGPVEYRTAGAYMSDYILASTGAREAKQRLEIFETRAAAHQKTSDNPGIIPEPVVGPVLNFIDAARPIVNVLGPRSMPGAVWKRPVVTGHTAVAVQGAAGLAADEKTELVSQKMTITNLTANAITYGGYVNVSRQNIDFASPNALDVVVNDLAAQYAIETEAATGAILAGATNTVELATAAGATPTGADLMGGLWGGAAKIYEAMRGMGRIVVAISPDMLGLWGQAFGNSSPNNPTSSGFSAGDFSQGIVGNVSGIQFVVSSGLPTGSQIMFSTSAVEVYEQRVGQLQVAEPSVLGVQVAYAGYFTPLVINPAGVQKIVNAA